MMKLSDRLQMIADLIENGQTVADIGTDHGFLPIYLWESKKSPKLILADISSGSLQKAIDNVEKQGYGKEILREHFDFRLGNGIEVLADGEADTVVIAGMGGILMTEILGKDLKKTGSMKRFILQPRTGQGKLRWWLEHNGFIIKKEKIVREGKFLCEIILTEARIADSSLIEVSQEEEEEQNPSEDIKYEVPESILIGNGAIAFEFVEQKLKNEQKILENKKKAVCLDEEEIHHTESRIGYLQQLLKNRTERGE
ncbi:tRNA (adenine(22)-N(1))-methyltransferase [Aminipila luticellarii]|uniref:SAM-dependent methyltransferase n=1 Tax=Aminipila luticellarii TaxID=2507160 RepID=A0A410PVC6_9FIRM|nr:class I SAM-dependent methyltransferase [Aminipila luticellarii]QAT42899.1 SAM-dependent methyltransferase [Aminipila luticellarii]